MKKSKIFFALAGLALIFAGCSDISSGDDNALITNGFTSTDKEAKPLTLNATSDKKLLTFPVADSSSRTILPAAVDASGDSVKFFLSFTDQLATTPEETMFTGDADSTTPKAVDFVAESGSTSKGTIALTFDVSVYSFTLYCVPASLASSVTTVASAKTNSMFIGYANADLRYNDAITFYMTADKSTGSGNVKLRLWSSDNKNTTDLYDIEEGYAVSAAIYSKNDDTVLYPTSGTAQSIMTATFKDDDATIGRKLHGTDAHTFEATGATPGEYTFAVAFKSTSKTYYYSEEIVILPNQTTEADVIIPQVYDNPPEPPSAFFVTYADPLVKTEDYYYAQFAWSDNSNNEQEFVIELLPVDDEISNLVTSTDYKKAAAPTDDASWSAAYTAYGKSSADIIKYTWKDYQTSPFNPAPETYSLIKNNNTAVFKLPLGKRYLARIRAVNEASPLDTAADSEKHYAYAHITNDVQTGTTGSKIEHLYNKDTGDKITDFTEVDVSSKIYCLEMKDFGTATSPDLKPIAYSTITPANGDIPRNGNVKATVTGYTFKAWEKVTEPDPEDGTKTIVVSDVLTINRYRIKYNLNDGEFGGAYNSSTGKYTDIAANDQPATVVFATQKYAAATATLPVGEAILIPDGNAKSTGNDTATEVKDTGSGTDYLSASGDPLTGQTLFLVSTKNGVSNKFSRWLLYSVQDTNKVVTDGGNRYPTTQLYWKKDAYDTTGYDYTKSAWTTTTINGAFTRLNPNVYTGHGNLELFASYALDTTASVTIADYTEFEWLGYGETFTYTKEAEDDSTQTAVTATKLQLGSALSYNTTDSKWYYTYTGVDPSDATKTKEKKVEATPVVRSDISLIGLNGTTEVEFDELVSDGATSPKTVLVSKNDRVTVSASASPTIKFTLDKTMNAYDAVSLKVRRTDSQFASYSYKKDLTLATYNATTEQWSADVSVTIDVKPWKSGVYEFTFEGTSKKYPNYKYTFPIVIDLRD